MRLWGFCFVLLFCKPLSSLRRLPAFTHLGKVHRRAIGQGGKAAWTLGGKSHFEGLESLQ